MRYVIQNTTNKKYFEQDFAGWSWQEEYRLAFKFPTKALAEEAIYFLREEATDCTVVEGK